MRNANAILRDALELSEDERAELALRLVESLDVHHDDAEDTWAAEIVARVERLRSGRADTLDADDVLRRARAKLKSSRG